jgi:hypothetical protein
MIMWEDIINTSLRSVAALGCAAVVSALVGWSGSGAAIAVPVTGSAGGIDVAISAESPTTIRPGAAPMRFNVTLVNNTDTDDAQVGLVVSLGHCTCNPGPVKIMPAGSMRMLDPGTNTWQTVPYVAEGGGTDYLTRTLVAPFTLNHGETTHYQLELELNTDHPVEAGESAIDVTMTDVSTNKPIGASPTASLPITVEP